jgi:hypothetical protein
MKKRIGLIIVACLLIISVYFNIKPDSEKQFFISFKNSNLRETYDTFHSIKNAQQIATGKGVKVGIIDKYFGFANNAEMYSGGINFTGNANDFEQIAEHGLWMATTLKEISPDVEIYALNARTENKAQEASAIVDAIEWAIENKIDILTYSADAFEDSYRSIIDSAVRKAVDSNIAIVFLHYDLKENILPFAFLSDDYNPYSRQIDLNVFHFDYNLLILEKYYKYVELGRKNPENFGDQPFLSFSSMPIVIAGVTAMVKEINNSLTPSQIKDLLIETSYELTYGNQSIKRVLNASMALKTVIK